MATTSATAAAFQAGQRRTMRRLATVVGVAVILSLTACGDDSGDRSATTNETTTTEESSTEQQLDAKKLEPKVERERIDELGTSKPEVERRRKPKKSKPLPESGAASFPPEQRAMYETSEAVCEVAKPAGIAREYGIGSRNAVEVAQAYSEEAARPAFQQAAFEGCLAGFGIK